MRNWLGVEPVEHQQKTSGQKKGLLLLGGGIFFFRAWPRNQGAILQKDFETAGGDFFETVGGTLVY